jgi:microcystin-dependent protein
MADDVQAQVRITELPPATAAYDTDLYEVSQAGTPGNPATSRRITQAMLKAAVKPDLSSYLTGIVPGPGIKVGGSAPVIAVSMENLGRAGTYGDAQNIPEITTDDLGRVLEINLIPLPTIDLSPYAPLDSPAFTGTPTAPTPPQSTNNARLATCAFVQGEIAARAFLTDAPHDGNTYARKDGAWVEAAGGGGDDGGEYSFSGTITPPPAAGEIRLNNATQSASDRVYLSGTTASGASAYNVLMLSLKAGVKLLLQDRDDSTRWLIFRATADAIDHATWAELPVALDTASTSALNPGSRILTFTAAPAGGSVQVGETAPAAPLPNMLWWNSALGILFLWYDDGNTKQWVPASPAPIGQSIPPGSTMDYAGAAAPNGWLLCQGQLVSRAAFPGLFAAIGTLHGAGDGSTTFALPDCGGRVTVGTEAVGTRLTVAISGVDSTKVGAVGGDQQMPAHSHPVTAHQGLVGQNLTPGTSRAVGTADGVNSGYFQDLSVGIGTAGAGVAQNVQPVIVMNKIIKT